MPRALTLNPSGEHHPEVRHVQQHLGALRSAVPSPSDLTALRGTLPEIEDRLAKATGELSRLAGDHDAAMDLVKASTSAVDTMELSADSLTVLEQIRSANDLLQEVIREKTGQEQILEETLSAQEASRTALSLAEAHERTREERLAEQRQFENGLQMVGRDFATELLLDEEVTYGADAILEAIASWDKSIAVAQAQLETLDFEALESALPGLREEIQTIEARLERLRARLAEITTELRNNPLSAVPPASPEFTALLERKTALTSEGVPLRGQEHADHVLLDERNAQLQEATRTLGVRDLLVQTLARRAELAERLKTLLPQEKALVGVEEETVLMDLDWDSLGLSVPGFTVPGMPVAPVLETIAVLREKGAPLSPRTTEGLAFLAGFAPKMAFEGLRPEELDRVVRALATVATGRKDVKEILFDLASGMLRMRDLPERVRRFAEELVKRFENEADYAPQNDTVRILVNGALEANPNLLKRNVDLTSFDPTGVLTSGTGGGAEPFELLRYLLVLQELQKVYAQERQPLTVEAFLKPVSELIQFHAELMLKFKKAGRRLSDSLPTEAHAAVFDGMRFLVSVQAQMLGKNSLTAPQQTKVQTIMQEYVGLVETAINSDTHLATIALGELQRDPQDAESAAMELRLTLNDFPRRLARGPSPLYGSGHSFLVLNKVLAGMGCPTPENPERNPESVIQDETVVLPYLTKYISGTPEDRTAIQTRILAGATNDYERHIMNWAFAIIDPYAKTDV